MARDVATTLPAYLTKREQTELAKISSEIILHGEKTKITDDLSNAVTNGAAFHHAGLNRDHRRIVEQAFKAGKIKIISATPTLASGVNLPARAAVIGSYKRWTAGYGMYPISVLEYKQMSGRAGRPQYDDYGEAVLIAKTNIVGYLNSYIFSGYCSLMRGFVASISDFVRDSMHYPDYLFE